MILTGRLIAAGRALAGITANDLGTCARIEVERLRHLEASGAAWISPEDSERLFHALETFGIVFLEESDGLGAGVRLKFTRQDVRQILRLETEGGVARSDDVP
jgi:hypothetical protein